MVKVNCSQQSLASIPLSWKRHAGAFAHCASAHRASLFLPLKANARVATQTTVCVVQST
jgi:hypothetical protein